MTKKSYLATEHECTYHTCQNGGTCQYMYGVRKCVCPPNFAGKSCELKKCKIEKCLNGGLCNHTNNGITCDCTETGFEGEKCEANVRHRLCLKSL